MRLHRTYPPFHARRARARWQNKYGIPTIPSRPNMDVHCGFLTHLLLQFAIPSNPMAWRIQVANANSKLRDWGTGALCQLLELALSPNLPSALYGLAFQSSCVYLIKLSLRCLFFICFFFSPLEQSVAGVGSLWLHLSWLYSCAYARQSQSECSSPAHGPHFCMK